MKIACFVSHPIQYFAPLWKEVSRRPGVELKVFYYSQHALRGSRDPEFGINLAWDIDLLDGYAYEFLPRQWPTTDPNDYSQKGLNKHLVRRLREGWDIAYVCGYMHLNNWLIAAACGWLGIPLLCQNDVSLLTERDKNRLKLLVKQLIVRGFFRTCSGFLAVGDHSRDYFMHYGASARTIHFCPYVVDVERFRRTAESATAAQREEVLKKYAIPANKRLVLFSGKLIPRKRPLDLVAALMRLGRDDVVGVFIGEGELRSEIERLGKDRVVVTGFVNQREIPLLLSLGTLLVLPSSYEAYGIAVTEALSLGVPAVVSDRCGCYGPNGILRDGETGLLYSCGNVEQLAQRINYMLNNDELRERMGRRGREISENMSPAAVADTLVEAAEQAAKTSRRARLR